MTLARAAVAIGVAALVALAVYLFVLRASGHEYTLIFENAGQLVKGDNVQIGGRAVGTVKAIELTSNNADGGGSLGQPQALKVGWAARLPYGR